MSYTTYTIGCLAAWAVVWIIIGTQASHSAREKVLYVFLGWVIGWTSATIARAVYPPPRRNSSASSN